MAESLKEVFIEDMRDLWSANDQMHRLMKTLADKASDSALKQQLTTSVGGIEKHTAALKSILEKSGGVSKDHCKGMEGLVAEAKKHADRSTGPMLDLSIIAQYQRMSHYGIAGFGTAAAYAKALGMSDAADQLAKISSDIYQADEYASKTAEHAEKAAAKSKA